MGVPLPYAGPMWSILLVLHSFPNNNYHLICLLLCFGVVLFLFGGFFWGGGGGRGECFLHHWVTVFTRMSFTILRHHFWREYGSSNLYIDFHLPSSCQVAQNHKACLQFFGEVSAWLPWIPKYGQQLAWKRQWTVKWSIHQYIEQHWCQQRLLQ